MSSHKHTSSLKHAKIVGSQNAKLLRRFPPLGPKFSERIPTELYDQSVENSAATGAWLANVIRTDRLPALQHRLSTAGQVLIYNPNIPVPKEADEYNLFHSRRKVKPLPQPTSPPKPTGRRSGQALMSPEQVYGERPYEGPRTPKVTYTQATVMDDRAHAEALQRLFDRKLQDAERDMGQKIKVLKQGQLIQQASKPRPSDKDGSIAKAKHLAELFGSQDYEDDAAKLALAALLCPERVLGLDQPFPGIRSPGGAETSCVKLTSTLNLTIPTTAVAPTGNGTAGAYAAVHTNAIFILQYPIADVSDFNQGRIALGYWCYMSALWQSNGAGWVLVAPYCVAPIIANVGGVFSVNTFEWNAIPPQTNGPLMSALVAGNVPIRISGAYTTATYPAVLTNGLSVNAMVSRIGDSSAFNPTNYAHTGIGGFTFVPYQYIVDSSVRFDQLDSTPNENGGMVRYIGQLGPTNDFAPIPTLPGLCLSDSISPTVPTLDTETVKNVLKRMAAGERLSSSELETIFPPDKLPPVGSVNYVSSTNRAGNQNDTFSCISYATADGSMPMNLRIVLSTAIEFTQNTTLSLPLCEPPNQRYHDMFLEASSAQALLSGPHSFSTLLPRIFGKIRAALHSGYETVKGFVNSKFGRVVTPILEGALSGGASVAAQQLYNFATREENKHDEQESFESDDPTRPAISAGEAGASNSSDLALIGDALDFSVL